MKEGNWLAAKDPQPLLDFLRGRASDRKLRLFAVACCREVWDLLDAAGRAALEVAERYADGEATRIQATEATAVALGAERTTGKAAKAVYWATKNVIRDTLRNVCEAAAEAAAGAAVQKAPAAGRDRGVAWEQTYIAAAARQADLVRESFGNPFRPLAVDPAWLAWGGGIVGRLAQGAYEARAFDRLPVLADALEEAGCTDTAILEHCRSGGRHVRGCWVVDALCARE
jgi:hypothetical protein